MKNVLFVCLGNICRSSLAEGILRAELSERGRDDILVDSAGTGNWHIGKSPDHRAIAIANQNGIDISQQRARQGTPADVKKFDLIVAMDIDNLADLMSIMPFVNDKQLVICRSFGSRANDGNVPDPYYGDDEGFQEVMTILKDCCKGIADHVIRARE